jgi:hypothetical protein
MAWFDFLKYGNELAELLIEGQNPYSASLLQAADVAALQPHMHASDRAIAYVQGRVVLAGRGLWVLTERHLLIAQQANGHQVHAHPLNEVSKAQCVRGKYGYTLRVTIAGQQFSMYGASATLSAMFYQALGQTVDCAAVFKPPQLDADDLAQGAHHFAHAASLLHPATQAVA